MSKIEVGMIGAGKPFTKAGLGTVEQPCCASPCAELRRLRHRETVCPTKRDAEVVALVRCFQECCDALGVSYETTSPRQLVAKVKAVMRNAGRQHLAR